MTGPEPDAQTSLMERVIYNKDSVPLFRRGDAFRIVRDLVAKRLSDERGQDIFSLGVTSWTGSTQLRDSDLDLGSMELVGCAETVSQFFCLPDYGAEDYLLAKTSFADWVEIVAISLENTGERFCFQTSGSTGDPKSIFHRTDTLIAEAQEWSTHVKGASRLVTTVPAHHIYGFIWTALLPNLLDVPVLDLRVATPGKVARSVAPGDLLVSVPSQWEALFSVPELNLNGLYGVSAAGPVSSGLWQKIEQSPVDFIEIYGSSETAGIGCRSSGADPFQLMDRWGSLSAEKDAQFVTADPKETKAFKASESDENRDPSAVPGFIGQTAVYDLPDHIVVRESGRHFDLGSRRDGAVSIDGNNVFPASVEAHFLRHENVNKCAVRYDAQLNRLKIYIVPNALDIDTDALIQTLRHWADQGLSSSARPAHYTVGPALPTGDMGKRGNWTIAL